MESCGDDEYSGLGIGSFAFGGVGMIGGVRRVVAVEGSRSFDDGDCYTVHLKDLDMSHITGSSKLSVGDRVLAGGCG